MKVRLGFVSNSSSSSFCLFGATLSDMDEIAEFLGKTTEEVKDEDFDIYDKLSEKCNKEGLQFVFDYECENAVVGLPPEFIGNRETGGAFKKRVNKILKKHELGKGDWEYGEIYN